MKIFLSISLLIIAMFGGIQHSFVKAYSHSDNQTAYVEISDITKIFDTSDFKFTVSSALLTIFEHYQSLFAEIILYSSLILPLALYAIRASPQQIK